MKINSRLIKITLAGFLTVCFFVIALFNVSVANAGFLCKSRGTSGLSVQYLPRYVRTHFSAPHIEQRKYTMTELFADGSFSYSLPFAHNEEDGFIIGTNTVVEDDIKSLGYTLPEDAKQRMKDINSGILECTFGELNPSFNNFFKGLNITITNLVKWTISMYFDSSWICDNPTSTNCINIIGITGGDGTQNNTGIIGKLTTGIYYPFLGIAMIFVMFHLLYKGIVKRAFREATSSLLWVGFSLAFGIIALINPFFLAKLPKDTTNVISYCLVQAFNGKNCMDTATTTNANPDKINACTSYTTKDISHSEYMTLFAEETNCNIEKSLVIENWTKDQFGYSFDDLYTKNAPNGHSEYPSSKLIGKPEDYCVKMYFDKTPEPFLESRALSEGTFNNKTEVCNIALAYMSSRTLGGQDKLISLVIGTASNDEVMWNSFKGTGREPIGILSTLSTIVVAISFIPVALFANVFSLQSLLLMMFAPLFLLFMIEPSKGKRIFLGWLESLVSATLKFMGSGFILFVMLTIYSSVLSSLGGFASFIITLIFAVSFGLYRKEILSIMGNVSFGGQKIANKLGSALEKAGEKTKNVATSVGAGAVGGMVAAKAQGHKITQGLMRGAGTGLTTELAKGSGVVAQSVKTGRILHNKYKAENKEELREERENIHTQQKIEAVKQSGGQIAQSVNKNTKGINHAKTLNLASQYSQKVSSQLPFVKNSLFTDQIKNQINKIQDSPDIASVRANGRAGIEMAEISKGIEQYSASNNGNEDKGVDLFVKDLEAKQTAVIKNEIAKLEAMANSGQKTDGTTYSMAQFTMDKALIEHNFNTALANLKAEFMVGGSNIQTKAVTGKKGKVTQEINTINLEKLGGLVADFKTKNANVLDDY